MELQLKVWYDKRQRKSVKRNGENYEEEKVVNCKTSDWLYEPGFRGSRRGVCDTVCIFPDFIVYSVYPFSDYPGSLYTTYL